MVFLLSRLEKAVDEKMARRAMLMREVELSVGMARARDSLMWYGSLYSVFATGVLSAKLAGKALPPVLAVPIVMGGFGLANLTDLAYGNKLCRIVKEAEHIMDHERGRLIPPHQAPFSALYGADERSAASDAGAVGSYWPSFMPMARER